ncbi:MAG TPA: NUDIX hydrolase [Dehalococcoidales bacterium]
MSESPGNDSRWYPQLPMVGVSAVVLKEGRMLLVKRSKEPSKGKWSIPGGRLELGEAINEAAKREVLEECSIEIEIERVLEVTDNIMRDEEGRTRYHFVLIDLLARYTGGEARAQSDAEECRWVTTEELAGLDMNPQLCAVLMRAMSS